MKRRWKIFWIVCAALAVTGVLCCAAAAAMGATPEMVAQRFPNVLRTGDDLDDLDDIFDDDDDDYDDDDYDDDDYDDDDAYVVPESGSTAIGHHAEDHDNHKN